MRTLAWLSAMCACLLLLASCSGGGTNTANDSASGQDSQDDASDGSDTNSDDQGDGTTDQDPTIADQRMALGEYLTDTTSLTFNLPGSFGDSYVYVPPAGGSAKVRQAQEEQLLASASLMGALAPEVEEGRTTRVPLNFDLRGRGSIQVTRWRASVRHQTTGDGQDQSQAVDPETGRATIIFMGLAVGRWDATVEMYGIAENAATGGDGTGSVEFDLSVTTDTSA